MKKFLMLLTGLLLSVSSYSQSYRGMFELGIGLPASSKTFATQDGSVDVKPTWGGIFSTTHGCQISKSFFVGLGAGISCTWYDTDELDNKLPTNHVFLDLRWDLDIRKKITPFVDLKAGYLIKWNSSALIEEEFHKGAAVRVDSKNSMYFQPTAGVRFRGGKRTGFNLGISYIPVLKRTAVIWEDNNPKQNEVDFNEGLLMLNLGFDF